MFKSKPPEEATTTRTRTIESARPKASAPEPIESAPDAPNATDTEIDELELVPSFELRADDPIASTTIAYWIDLATSAGADAELIKEAREVRAQMIEWQGRQPPKGEPSP